MRNPYGTDHGGKVATFMQAWCGGSLLATFVMMVVLSVLATVLLASITVLLIILVVRVGRSRLEYPPQAARTLEIGASGPLTDRDRY